MTNPNKNYYENLTFPPNEPDPQGPPRRRMGGSVLARLRGTSPETPSSDSGGFEYLFPAVTIPPQLLHEAATAEGAEQLVNKLDDDDPYKDYALSQLALHFIKQGDLEHANMLLHRVSSDSTATYVLSQLVKYEDDHGITTQFGEELHNLAIHAYDATPSAQSARAISEASEALPDDQELREYARKAIAEHPEVLPHVG